MRMHRLCEYKGRLDLGAYLALREHISIGEALEIEAAGLVIADHTAEFADFFSGYKQGSTPQGTKSGGGAVLGPAGATADQLQSEIDSRQKALERSQNAVMGHRQAIAYAASGQDEPPGRLDPRALAHVETSVRSHTEVIAYLNAQIEGLTSGK